MAKTFCLTDFVVAPQPPLSQPPLSMAKLIMTRHVSQAPLPIVYMIILMPKIRSFSENLAANHDVCQSSVARLHDYHSPLCYDISWTPRNKQEHIYLSPTTVLTILTIHTTQPAHHIIAQLGLQRIYASLEALVVGHLYRSACRRRAGRPEPHPTALTIW